MKKLILIICLCFLSLGAFTQKKNAWSLEATSGTYLYYLIQQNEYEKYSNRFNYEFSIIGSRYLSKLKLSTGIMYSTKNIAERTFVSGFFADYIFNVDYSIQYVKLPILLSFGKTFNPRISLNFEGGFIVDRILKYNLSIAEEGKPYSDKNYYPKRIGISARAGLELSIKLTDKGYLNINPFVDYKLLKDNITILYHYRWGAANIHEYQYNQIPNGKDKNDPFSDNNGGLLLYGLSIGFEYVFK